MMQFCKVYVKDAKWERRLEYMYVQTGIKKTVILTVKCNP